jgi:hypothetical protein
MGAALVGVVCARRRGLLRLLVIPGRHVALRLGLEGPARYIAPRGQRAAQHLDPFLLFTRLLAAPHVQLPALRRRA